MAVYRILFKRSVEKDFAKIPKKDLRKILGKIKALGINPRPVGYEKLSAKEQYRIRQGKYRIVYSIQDDESSVWIVKVGHRRDAYK